METKVKPKKGGRVPPPPPPPSGLLPPLPNGLAPPAAAVAQQDGVDSASIQREGLPTARVGPRFGRGSRLALRGEIDVVTDYGNKHKEMIQCKSENFETSHFGADRKLVEDIAAFARGERSPVTGEEGLEATRMILEAMRSIDEGGQTRPL